MEAFIRNLKEHFKGRFDIEVKEVCKNNGTGYTGMFFRNTEGVASPVICLERYFRDHGQGQGISSIIGEIEEEICKAKAKVGFDPRELLDFEQVKDKLRIRLINSDWNRDLLKTRVHRDICDLAVVYALDMGEYMEGTKAVRPVINISQRELEMWDVNDEDVYLTAIENMKKHSRFTLTPVEDLIGSLCGSDTGGCGQSDLFVLTDINGRYPGTAAMADNACLKQISEMLHGSYYILPSSVHEVLIRPAENTDDAEELNEIVVHANRNVVSREEQLSYHVYYYDAARCMIRAA